MQGRTAVAALRKFNLFHDGILKCDKVRRAILTILSTQAVRENRVAHVFESLLDLIGLLVKADSLTRCSA